MKQLINEWKENVSVTEATEIEKYDEQNLSEVFSNKLSFGTGGVRAKMGVGPSLLNKYTVAQITSAYAKYLKDMYASECSIILGRDCRNNGELFTNVVINILEDAGINVITFDDIMPTPIISYFIRQYKAQGAIILTASHNPKEYNGYKVYNDTGAQLNLDEANSLIKYVDNEPIVFDVNSDFKVPYKYISDEEIAKYLKDVSQPLDTTEKGLKIVFSSIHGTTYKTIPEIFKLNGFNNLYLVEEQMTPDGDFPTTISANPEDPQAFDLARKYVLDNNADIAITTDPDGDRIGVLSLENGDEIIYTGNEMGALLINYLLETNNYGSESIIYKTIVTGDLGATIARDHDVNVEETLTGFKFIGEKIELENEKQFVFGYEESYGYLFNELVRDKDSIQSALQIAKMFEYYKNKEMMMHEVLTEIKQKYGFYEEKTFAYTCDDLSVITSIIDYSRTIDGELFGYKINSIVDYDKDETGLPKADVIKLFFDDMWVVFRPSGTEPKIKFYVSIKGSTNDESIKKMSILKNKIDELVDSIAKQF